MTKLSLVLAATVFLAQPARADLFCNLATQGTPTETRNRGEALKNTAIVERADSERINIDISDNVELKRIKRSDRWYSNTQKRSIGLIYLGDYFNNERNQFYSAVYINEGRIYFNDYIRNIEYACEIFGNYKTTYSDQDISIH